MAVKTFAAIDVGSYELSMKIFEVSKARGIHEIDHIRHSIDMGTETYITGKLGYESPMTKIQIISEQTRKSNKILSKNLKKSLHTCKTSKLPIIIWCLF